MRNDEAGCRRHTAASDGGASEPSRRQPPLVAEGQRIFRFDTFGDEQLWTDKLRLHEVVEKNVDPTTALKVGLKVDADVLPAGILEKVDLKSPATTVALLKMNAVVGLQATVDANNHITRLGVTCALCHSTVDNSVMPGIGRRKDGWPNRDLNVGAIIALSPALPADKKAVYKSWGPGKYDPRYNQDGKNTPLVLPPAYGLAASQERNVHGGGTDLLLECLRRRHPDGRARQLLRPAARDRRQALAGHGHAPSSRRCAPTSTACRRLHLRPEASMPPIAERGRAVFDRTCASCHVGGSGTDNNSGTLHPPAETGVDGAYAARTANKAYRTTPLRALWQHAPYFHDGSAATLADVVAHYNRVRKLGLTAEQQRDLVEYLKSL